MTVGGSSWTVTLFAYRNDAVFADEFETGDLSRRLVSIQ